MLVADTSFLDALWWMLVFFFWVMYFWIFITVVMDLFRRHDTSGVKKAVWIIFLIFVPLLGVLIYLIVNNDDMAKRNIEAAQRQKQDFDQYVQSVSSGSSAEEIAKAKQLLDSGAITQAEFDALKAKALGTTA